MQYVSTKGKSEPVSFEEAAFQGLAPDGGLYMPSEWPRLSPAFLAHLNEKSLQEIGMKISRLFINALSDIELQNVIDDALNFPAPLVQLGDNLYVLELFHGPTLAFKDFGARFMSRMFSALKGRREQNLIILVATSGDTGSAVAQGFLGVEGIKVCLLYPKGKVSKIQEQQLTTAGQNVTALEVDGTFDDCQRMVKAAFSDRDLNQKLLLSSANSINIARLLPQSFYYLNAIAQLKGSAPIFCVPSGNFGNITAGLMAQKMGMPCKGFIAATNNNDTFLNYWETGDFKPKPSRKTISNAMDVGDPSNFSRIQAMFNQSYEELRKYIWSTSVSDERTRIAINQIFKNYGYIADPHTAVGYESVKRYQHKNPGYFGESGDDPIILLSTAHPAKFSDIIAPIIGETVPVPGRLRDCMKGDKRTVEMPSDDASLKKWLINKYY